MDLNGIAAFRTIAEDTGGRAVVSTNDFSGAFQQIVRDSSTYYLLGFYPSGDVRDGRFHDVRVRVTRPGLTVRARPGYWAPRADAAIRPPLAVADGLAPDARLALRSPLPTSGLTVEAFATPFKGSGATGSVLVGRICTGPTSVWTPRTESRLLT